MKLRAISTVLAFIVLGSGTPAGAQDAGVEDAAVEEDPSVGALPLEDPTIEPPRDEDLRVDDSPEATAEVAATESSAGGIAISKALSAPRVTGVDQDVRRASLLSDRKH